MSERMAMDGLRAFDRASDGSWKQTPETEKVLNVIRSAGGKDFKIEPAPSVLADVDGMGMWGSGGGVHFPDGSGTFVDPVFGNVSTAAHEAAHASLPTALISEKQQDQAWNKLYDMGNAPFGNQARAVYETISKPIMLEEANAQGVAAGAMNKAGYDFNTNGWQNSPMNITGLAEDIPAALTYPGQYRFGGMYDRGATSYKSAMNIGEEGREYLPEEVEALDRTMRSHIPAMKRQFEAGYNLIK